MLGVYLLTFLGFGFYYAAFPVHAVRALGCGATGVGAYFAILSLMMVAVQGPFLGVAARRFSNAQLMVGGSALLGVSFFLLNSRHPLAVGASVVLLAVGNGLMWPSVVASLAMLAGEHLQGSAQGLAGSAGALASVVGLLAGGLLYERIGEKTFVLAGACIIAAGLASVPLLRSDPP